MVQQGYWHYEHAEKKDGKGKVVPWHTHKAWEGTWVSVGGNGKGGGGKASPNGKGGGGKSSGPNGQRASSVPVRTRNQ